MKQIAIMGPTASGKTALSIDIAQKTNSVILSLDSLAVYKEIDIASAKPTLNERAGIKHFGIDEVMPDETFDVIYFLKTYQQAKEYAENNKQNLIIVGGTGFYLKILIEGISLGVEKDSILEDSIQQTHKMLLALDEEYMKKISQNDSYRVQKAFSIYKQTGLTPTLYFKENPKVPIAPKLKLFEILWEREELRNRIKQRTSIMLNEGLIDEVISLERKYSRKPNSMKSIGILETLEYLDGHLTKQELEDKIALNTAKLAKRQVTFNKGQFKGLQIANVITSLNSEILKSF